MNMQIDTGSPMNEATIREWMGRASGWMQERENENKAMGVEINNIKQALGNTAKDTKGKFDVIEAAILAITTDNASIKQRTEEAMLEINNKNDNGLNAVQEKFKITEGLIDTQFNAIFDANKSLKDKIIN